MTLQDQHLPPPPPPTSWGRGIDWWVADVPHHRGPPRYPPYRWIPGGIGHYSELSYQISPMNRTWTSIPWRTFQSCTHPIRPRDSPPPDIGYRISEPWIITVQVILCGGHCYFSRIRFANWVWQEGELLTYFYLTRFPTEKSEFQNIFESCSRYSHTPPETAVIVNR